MHSKKLSLTLAAAVASALACSGTQDLSAKDQHGVQPTPSIGGSVAIAAADSPGPVLPPPTTAGQPAVTSDTTAPTRATAVAGTHPTPPVLDSLIKGTLAARGL